MLEIATAIALATSVNVQRHDVAYTTGKAYYYQANLDTYVSNIEKKLPDTLKKSLAYSGTMMNLVVNRQMVMIWKF